MWDRLAARIGGHRVERSAWRTRNSAEEGAIVKHREVKGGERGRLAAITNPPLQDAWLLLRLLLLLLWLPSSLLLILMALLRWVCRHAAVNGVAVGCIVVVIVAVAVLL